MPSQSAAAKVQIAREIFGGRTCRIVFAAQSRDGAVAQAGHVLRLVGKKGRITCSDSFKDYVDAHGDGLVAPLVRNLIDDTLVGYDHLDEDRALLKISLGEIIIVEPSTEASATPEVEERIRVLEALQETTNLTQLQGLAAGLPRRTCHLKGAGRAARARSARTTSTMSTA